MKQNSLPTKPKTSRKQLREFIEKGYENHEIEDQLGVPHGYLSRQIQRIRIRIAAEDRAKRQEETLVIYYMPLEEVYQRYGRPGQYKESAPMIIDVEGLADRKGRRADEE